jgi:transcriptional regulator with XRE-family HTH domain
MGKSGEHAVFAANLRRLCETQTSIADICRDTGINRQQFNKYLAGRAIPSAPVLRRICQRLGVSEDALLTSSGVADEASAAGATGNRYSRLGKDVERLFSLYMPELKSVQLQQMQDFGPGCYHIYFPFSDVKDYLLCAYIEVWWHKDVLMFTRTTRLKNPGRSNLPLRARHFGVVLASKGEATMLARNKLPPYQISVVNIKADLLFQRYHVGIAMTHAGGPFACRVVLDRLDSSQPRKEHLRKCGMMRFDAPAIPHFVREALQPDAQRGPTIQLPAMDQLISSAIFSPR